MKISIEIGLQSYTVDTHTPMSIAIPLHFNAVQPNAHGVQKATASPERVPGMVGDTRQHGSVNWERYALSPHSNGTHTECIGHITSERIAIHDTFSSAFIPSVLISVSPTTAEETDDSYHPSKALGDAMITRSSLVDALGDHSDLFCEGVVIRTLPNEVGKIERCYLEKPPAFFSLEAMQYLVSRGVKHLLVDIPSVDRASDEGELAIHRLFWNVPLSSTARNEDSHSDRTITEMIFVPDSIHDGCYLLNIQVPSFMSDAAPSRPILFPLSPSMRQ